MASKKGRCCAVTLIIFAILNLILALLLLVAFPLGIYPAILRSQIPIKADGDGQLTKSGYLWSEPPSKTDYYFYFFDVQNPDAILISNDKPQVKERGPYHWKEQDKRVDISFSSDKSNVSYKVMKTYTYTDEGSCLGCTYNDYIVIPNLSMITMTRLLFENAKTLSATQVLLADLTTILLGVYPFSQVKMSEATYVGYTDNLIDFLQSPLKKELDSTFGNVLGFDPPDIKLLGFFAGYNQSTDGEYVAMTGQSGVEQTGLIQSWRGLANLTFWASDETNSLKDSTDGALSGGFLEKKSLKFFQSYLCRHFPLVYDSEDTVEDIKAYKFKFDANSYNPYQKGFEGYLFNNTEKLDFYPNWNSTEFVTDVTKIPLPPGLVQQKCIPGKLDPLPFTAFGSAPHFLGAPDEVQSSIDGLNANEERHALGEFYIQPKLGSALKANVRSQLNIAMSNNSNILSLTAALPTVYPIFWLHTHVELKSSAYDFIKMSLVTVPKIALFTGIGIAVISGLFLLAFILLMVFMRRKRDDSSASSSSTSSRL